uniref:Uncharacterized protein n=1 Tax=Ditylenchus dipsaci TaxID=166011 RepID=A0A915D491_9BILA
MTNDKSHPCFFEDIDLTSKTTNETKPLNKQQSWLSKLIDKATKSRKQDQRSQKKCQLDTNTDTLSARRNCHKNTSTEIGQELRSTDQLCVIPKLKSKPAKFSWYTKWLKRLLAVDRKDIHKGAQENSFDVYEGGNDRSTAIVDDLTTLTQLPIYYDYGCSKLNLPFANVMIPLACLLLVQNQKMKHSYTLKQKACAYKTVAHWKECKHENCEVCECIQEDRLKYCDTWSTLNLALCLMYVWEIVNKAKENKIICLESPNALHMTKGIDQPLSTYNMEYVKNKLIDGAYRNLGHFNDDMWMLSNIFEDEMNKLHEEFDFNYIDEQEMYN